MRIAPADIVREYILFPPRVDEGIVRLRDAPHHLSPTGEVFQHHLRALWRTYGIDDLTEMAAQAFNGRDTLLDWYLGCLDLSGIRIRFRDCSPRIGHGHFTDWRRLTFSLDPDALLMAEFIRTCQRVPQSSDLNHWGVHAISDNLELERICKSGIADIHTHLGGCDCMPVVWLDVMNGHMRIAKLPSYPPGRLDRVPDASTLKTQLKAEIEAIKRARKCWPSLIAPLEMTERWFDKAGEHHSPQALTLWPERQMLAQKWFDLGGKWTPQTARDLDRYLFGKNLFLSRHHQYPGSNPGLANFRDYLSRAPSIPRDHKRQRQRLQRMIGFCGESPMLHRVELRVSAFATVGDYKRFFKEWNKAVNGNAFLRGKAGLFYFVINFNRSADNLKNAASSEAFEKLRRDIDRKSAALHLFRLNDTSETAKLICGLDVAGQERQCAVEVFSPYLRLLRGIVDTDPSTGPRNLSAIPRDFQSVCLQHWDEVIRTRNMVSPWLNRLGLTYHAGEDFFHPLDGIRSIWNAIEHCKMMPGDRIGHGLAAGMDLRSFERTYGQTPLIPQGEIIDSLAWLYQRLHQSSEFTQDAHEIEVFLADLTQRVYGRPVHPDSLARIKRSRHKFRDLAVMELDKESQSLAEMEIYPGPCRQERLTRVPLPTTYSCLSKAIEYAQEQLIKFAAKKDIVFEFNPSSNVATTTIENLRNHPFFSIYAATKTGTPVRLTINCDDPGVFATRLENEYALMAEAIAERFETEPNESTMEILRKMANWAKDSVFCPATSSRN